MVVELAACPVAQHIGNGAMAGPFHGGHLQRAPARGQGGGRDGNIQREQPLHLVRLQQHFVAHGISRRSGWCAFCLLLVGGCSGKAAADPFLPVQPTQHRAAVIHGRARRRFAFKTHAKGNAVILRQFGNIAHSHVVAQAGFGFFVTGQAPQRRKTRKQHEQRQHDGRPQGGHAQGNEQCLAQRRVASRRVGIDQSREQSQHARQNADGCHQRLRKQKMAQQGKKAEKENDKRIALRFELQRFERQQQQDQSATGLAPENGAELRGRQGNDQHHKNHAHPAAGQRLLPDGEPCAPCQYAQTQAGYRPRHMRGLHQHHPADDGEQKKRVAAFARQGASRPGQPAP